GWGRGRAPSPRRGRLEVGGGRFAGVTRRREGRWWRCSRSAPVEGTPGLLGEGGWRGRAPQPRAGPLDVEGGGFSGVTRRREGRWWRCSRAAPVEGSPRQPGEGGRRDGRRSAAAG